MTRITQAQFEDLTSKQRKAPVKRTRARCQPPKPGKMNVTETAYAQELELLKASGEILDYRYEPLKFRLADKTFYNVDFMVIELDGTISFHEVKGYMEDDAAVKVKTVSELFPWFSFRIAFSKKRAKRDGGGYVFTMKDVPGAGRYE